MNLITSGLKFVLVGSLAAVAWGAVGASAESDQKIVSGLDTTYQAAVKINDTATIGSDIGRQLCGSNGFRKGLHQV